MNSIDQFAAHIGLDSADKKHDICVQFNNGERVFHVIEHTPEILDTWLKALHKKVKGKIAVAVELNNYLINLGAYKNAAKPDKKGVKMVMCADIFCIKSL